MQSALVKRLLAAKADPSRANRRKDTPLHLVVESADDTLAKTAAVALALLEANAPCAAKNRKRRTPYEHAVELHKPALAALIAKFDEFAAAFEAAKQKKGRRGSRS